MQPDARLSGDLLVYAYFSASSKYAVVYVFDKSMSVAFTLGSIADMTVSTVRGPSAGIRPSTENVS
jgi:hypothetical protein